MVFQRSPGLNLFRLIRDLDMLRPARLQRSAVKRAPQALDAGVVQSARNNGIAVAFERLFDGADQVHGTPKVASTGYQSRKIPSFNRDGTYSSVT